MGLIARIFTPLDKIPKDKLLHYVTGQVVALIALALPGFWIPMAVLLVVAVAKEIHDYYTPGHVAEWADVLASVLGGVPIFAAFALGKYL